MNEEQIRRHVLEVIHEVAPESAGVSIDPKLNFRDQVEIDSVDFLNYALKLEERMSVQIPEQDYPKLSSIDGAVAYLAARRESAAAERS